MKTGYNNKSIQFVKICKIIFIIGSVLHPSFDSFAEYTSSDTLRVSIPSLPKNCLATEAGITSSALVFNQVFNRLYEYSSQDMVEPFLVEGHTWEGAGKQLRISIKKGINFSDGSPVTAPDVYKSLMSALHLLNTGADWAFGNITGFSKFKKTFKESDLIGIKVINKYTLIFHFEISDYAFISILGSSMFFISKNGNSCIGTGAYKIKKIENNSVELDRNPFFAKHDLVEIKKINFFKNSSDFKNLDLVLGGQAKPKNLIEIKSKHKQMRLIVGIFNTKNSFFQSKEARCFVASQLQNFLKDPFFNLSEIDQGMPLAWNLSQLTEIKKNKKIIKIPKIKINISDSSFTFNELSAEKLEGLFKLESIPSKVQFLPIEENVDLATKGNFEVTVMGFVPDYFHPDSLLSSFVGTNQFYNLSKYSNQELDSLLLRGRISKTSEEQSSTYKKAFEILTSDCPVVFLGVPQSKIFARSPWITPDYSSLGFQFMKLNKMKRSNKK